MRRANVVGPVLLVLSVLGLAADAAAGWEEELAFPDAAAVSRHVKAAEGSPAARFFAPGTVELAAPFSTFRGSRVKWWFDIHADLRLAKGLSFEFMCTDSRPFSSFSIYVNSGGEGCYTGTFESGEDGKWTKVFLPKSAFPRNEDEVFGWSKVWRMSIAGWRNGTSDSVIRIRDIRPVFCRPDVVVLRSDASCQARREKDYVLTSARMTAFMEGVGLEVAEISDLELDDAVLEGVRFVVLPWNPVLPEGTDAALRRFIARGGKVLACYSLAPSLQKALGLRSLGFESQAALKKDGRKPVAGILRKGAGLPGQPGFVRQTSACWIRTELTGAGEVLATWGDADRGALPVDCLFRTPAGCYLAHVWKGEDDAALQLMHAILADAVPSWKARLDARVAEIAEERRAEAAWVAAQKSVTGEWRAFSCHDARGAMNGQWSWDRTVGFLKENGVNAMEPNVAWADGIFADEAHEALAACRKHGVQCSFWKVSWRPHSSRRRPAPGRTQVSVGGKARDGWLCPTDPANLSSEIDMHVELAKMRPDILSLDYVRYPDRDSCFCDGCLAAFERTYALKVADWPKDIRKNKELARKWTEFRCSNITALIRGVAHRVRKECPGVKIRIAVFSNPDSSPEQIGQDWAAWCREGLLDFIDPMNYTDSAAAQRRLLERQKEAVAGTGVKIYPTLGVSTLKTLGHDAKIVSEQINAVRAAGLDGYSVFQLDARGIEVLPELRKGVFRDR